MVNISDCFYYIINLLCSVMKLAVMICKSNRFLKNLHIVQCYLQIGWSIYQLADWQIGQNIYTQYTVVPDLDNKYYELGSFISLFCLRNGSPLALAVGGGGGEFSA